MSESEIPSTTDFSDLRDKAEAQLQQHPAAHQALDTLSSRQIQSLIHELQVHQIELEMQNEELRRTQRELEIKRDEYAELYDFAPIGYLTVDERGVILNANLTIAALLGLDRPRIVRRPLNRFVIPEDQDSYYRFYRQILATDGPHVAELRMVRHNQDTPVYARLEAIVRRSPETVFWITVSDVTEHRLAEQYALRTERLAAMENLATTLAHEIKNPLHALRLSMDLLFDPALSPEQHQSCLEICNKEVERLIMVSRSMLDFVRPERVTTGVTTAAGLVQDTLALVDAVVREAHVEVYADIPPNLPTIQVPQDQIIQILINIIINAVEAMGNGGWINISANVEENMLCFKLANKGPTIPPHVLQHIFDPYFTTKSQGMGLGLSVSRNIIRELAGDLYVENQSNGEGVVVTLTLPVPV